MQENADSVFQLLTDLCEKFYNDPRKIQQARTKCYEILLGKKCVQQKKIYKDLQGTTDPYLNLLAWQFQLAHNYDLKEHSLELGKAADKVKDCYTSDVESFNKILQFLMLMRNVPSKDKKSMDLATLPELPEHNFDDPFKLPPTLLEEYEQNKNLLTKKIYSNLPKPKESFTLFKLETINNNENYIADSHSPTSNIWDLVSKLPYSNRRNWENHGSPEPEKESLFLSELGDLSSLWVDNLKSLYMGGMFKDGVILRSKMVPRKNFIRDLKYLLVGLASESFSFDSYGKFYLLPNITVEGITPRTLHQYSAEFIKCGTYCKALEKMCSENLQLGAYKHLGFVYKEFCKGVHRYLQFYKTAVFTIPESTNYLQFSEKIYQLQWQISTLASICKVNHSTNSVTSVSLLNHLYQEVVSLMDEKLITVLYSILHSCCQIYFRRFLKQWILKGVLDDPFEEFFVMIDSKNILSRSRTYWTKSFKLREDMLPDFITDLKTDLLYCGQAMNLLKLCDPFNKLLGKDEPIINCCVTSDQLTDLKRMVSNYYLDVTSECKPSFEWENVMIKSESDPTLLRLMAKKRTTTLRRIELERQKFLEEEHQKKTEEITALKEQYLSAMEQKQCKIAREIEKEIKQMEEQFQIQLKEHQVIQEEANNMIEYYTKLFEAADNKKYQIETHIKKIKNITLDESILNKVTDQEKVNEIFTEHNSSCESFHTAKEGQKSQKIETKNEENDDVHCSKSMDFINANLTNEIEKVSDTNANIKELPASVQQAIENFQTAKKIKAKVMLQELGIGYSHLPMERVTENPKMEYLTEAQKNKLKVLSSEFNMPPLKPELVKVNNLVLANRNKVMGVSDCFSYKGLDNENFLNKNMTEDNNTSSKLITIKKSQSLKLDLHKAGKKSPNGDFTKPIPMSVDSTPTSEFLQSPIMTPSTAFLSDTTSYVGCTIDTGESQKTEDNGFHFPKNNENENNESNVTIVSKRSTKQEAAGVSTNCLRLFLHQSIEIPLLTQIKLVNEQLLNHFIVKLNYLNHLNYLRCYFFLQDGEFARNITDRLFTKLYNARFPAELINCATLQDLVFETLDNSNKHQENPPCCLSFKINNLPSCFDFGNPDMLDCFSLTYKVDWPLNILLPNSTIAKYDEIFKFLLKLNQMSWVLKTIFLRLKILAKEIGKREIYLMASPQYRKLHQCRHIMTHFVQTLQNYIVGEVLQSNWEVFEKNLHNVTNLNELFDAHTNYLKNILFMCFLNQKNVVLRKVVRRIFVVILKFFDYLRSREWKCQDGTYIHPNFSKLESIFKNFQEIVIYFFKVCRKMAKSRYQPHLLQLIDTLDINGYISNIIK